MPCLGLQVLGECAYDPSQPTFSLFSLGETVGAIALIGIVLQMATEKMRFRFRLHPLIGNFVFLLFGTALFMPIVAAVLPYIPGTATPLIGYPVFWEIFACVQIIVSSFLLYFMLRSSTKFSTSNHKAFVQSCVGVIASGDKDALLALAGELKSSAKSIISHASEYDRFDAYEAKRRGEEYMSGPSTISAIHLLSIISDKKLCRLIVTLRPGTAINFIGAIQEYSKTSKWVPSRAFINQIIRQSLLMPESILSREEDFEGLGFIKGFLTNTFGDPKFFDIYRPLQALHFYDKDQCTNLSIRNYCKALHMAFEGLIEEGTTGNFDAWKVAINELSDPLYNLFKQVKSENWQYDGEAGESIKEIEDTITNIIDLLNKNSDKFPSDPKSPIPQNEKGSYDEFEDNTIFGVVAVGVFRFFEQLSSQYENDEYVRHSTINIWIRLFPHRQTTQIVTEIQKRLWMLIEERVMENMGLHYPSMTRLMLNLIGYTFFAEDIPEPNLKFLKLLANNLQKSFQKDAVKANKCIPHDMIFDYKNNVLSFREKNLKLDQFK